MKQLISFCTSLLLFIYIAQPMNGQLSFGKRQLFNDDWKFMLQDDSLASNPQHDDINWRQLQLPHDWSIEGELSPTLASCTGFLPGGIGWYRKSFNIEHPSERYYIYFEGVYNRSSVYINGHLLGERPNGYISFAYELTPYIKAGENVIAVRVDHNRFADSRWYTGSGIYRNVWLVTAPEIHLAQWGATYRTLEMNDKEAVVEVDFAIDANEKSKDKLEVVASWFDQEGKRVSQKRSTIKHNEDLQATHTLRMTLPNPERWDLEHPYLYNLHVELWRKGKLVDSTTIPAGLRTLRFDANSGFYLNGKNMKVKGVCLHHDAGVLGAAVPTDVWRRRIETLKSLGVNAIRMSHNPQAPALYSLCDELGLLVMDEASDEWEFPKRKWIQGWNHGTPGFDGSYDFFEEWIEQDVTDMVRRDRNHPSIFMWSIGNEVDYPNDPYSHPILDNSTISQPMYGGYKPDAPNAERIGKIAQRLAKCVRQIDTSRPVTGALAGVVMSNETAYPQAIDVVGYNYTESRYEMDHQTYPERIIYGSENSHWPKDWHAVRDNDYIFGQFLWTGIDYLGESKSWPLRGFYSGLLDFGGYVKPRGWFRASLWQEKSMAYLGTYPYEDKLDFDANPIWNYEIGETIRVVCYTNAAQAQLLLNDTVIGAMTPYNDEASMIHWDIPFSPGTLKVVGYDALGNESSSDSIITSVRPYALKVSSDKQILNSLDDVAHLTIEIIDEHGVAVPLADNAITCTIDGPAKLLGLEGSNNSDMSSYTDAEHRAYLGRLLAYIQPTAKEGEITVKLKSPLLQGCEIKLMVE